MASNAGDGHNFSTAFGITIPYLYIQPHQSVMLGSFIILATIFVIAYYIYKKFKTKGTNAVKSPPKPRFRKRDKVLFYGRKMLRKVNAFSGVGTSGERSRLKKRQMVLKFAKKLLQLRKDSQPLLQVKEPPPEFLEADLPDQQEEQRLPREVLYMLRSIRVFGHFEKPLFLELCKHLESKQVPSGSYLFQVGDLDDSIFVVQSGRILVFITEPDGTELPLKEVVTGDSVTSLLSILDVLTGHPAPYKTVTARALEDSTIIRLPAFAFQEVFERYPESLVRVVQIIMIRQQRVTFVAMRNYLGLSNELINPYYKFVTQEHQINRTLGVYAFSPKSSPTKLKDKDLGLGTIISEFENPLPTADMNEQQNHIYSTSCPSADTGFENGRQSITSSQSDQSPRTRSRLRSLDETNMSRIFLQVSKTNNDTQVPKTNLSRKSLASLNADEKSFIQWDDSFILQVAIKDIAFIFGMEDTSLLEDKLSLRNVSAGSYLTKQDDQSPCLIFVVTGALNVTQKVVDKDEQAQLYVVYPGEIVGALAVLSGEPSFFTIRARHSSRVVCISKENFYLIMRERPRVVLNVAHCVVRRVSKFVRQIDFALDWMQTEAGRALYRQGEKSDCTYIVLSGRLRSVITHSNDKKELVAEYGRGDLAGIVEVLTQTERSTTVIAVRDTELAKLPEGLLNTIKNKYPHVVTRLIHLLGQRILGSWQKAGVSFEKPSMDSRPTVANLNTIAVLPVTDDVSLTTFTLELLHSLSAIGPTLRLTSEVIEKVLGPSALESINEYRLTSWLGQQEDMHRIVLYQSDFRMTPWTQRCIRHADCILIVALADQEPTVGKIEQHLDSLAVRAQKELILLHSEDTIKPKRTVEWLNIRGWCSSHHHMKCPKRMFTKKSQAKVMDMYQKLFTTEPDKHSDFSRLARFLTGTSVGLVLGGGGARGSAHVGMIRALNEAGIPIDIVGGVSIGSFMGALWCEERNITRVIQRAREWSLDMTSYWKKILDLTYPVTAMFTGSAFNHSIESVFKDTLVEDLWIPYFTVTTDITSSSMRVHRSGSMWRYVRASMSLSGYLPPLCDPVDGHLLLDGGYINNLPGDVMRSLGAKTVLAIDVGSQDDTDLTNYGDQLSGWWLLWKRWNPWTKPVKIPDLAEIQSRLAYVCCVRQLESVKSSDYCQYIRPPIDRFKTLQFGSFDEIMDVGYQHGKTLFAVWEKTGLLQQLTQEKPSDTFKHKQQPVTSFTQATFTDLAELVSRIQRPSKSYPSEEMSEESDDEEYEEIEDDMNEIEEEIQEIEAIKMVPNQLNVDIKKKERSSVTPTRVLASTLKTAENKARKRKMAISSTPSKT